MEVPTDSPATPASDYLSLYSSEADMWVSEPSPGDIPHLPGLWATLLNGADMSYPCWALPTLQIHEQNNVVLS